MRTLEIQNKTKYCYSICETTIDGCIKKARQLNKERDIVIEIRLDYLLYKNITILEILLLVDRMKMFCKNNKILLTIRTYNDGGKIKLDKNTYNDYIYRLYEYSDADAIDVEYKYYKKNIKLYNKLFKEKKMEIVLSNHFFCDNFNLNKYKKCINDMMKVNTDIIKFAVKTVLLDNLIKYMFMGREMASKIENCDKNLIFIAMGRIGKISRIWNEFTSTKMVFLNAYNKANNHIANITKREYLNKRKLLAKTLKNC